ncbi:PAS domain S-box protein [Uliginosibacterium sp. sgz301328]|uniref:hybrid sensor histidine kinase/response regulator n=1 Tax=Uliginosibacterium sp. sgz301328 TaxID=3243764 RepID=UPI00359D30AB
MLQHNPLVDDRIYRMLVEQTRDYALFLLDPQGNIATWNLGAQTIKGYYADEIIGQHFSVFYTPDAVARGWPDRELANAAAEGRFEDEGWRVRKDGSRFWANVVITALRDDEGRLVAFAKITRDITERRQHEETLRQSEERFRLLIEGVVDYAIYMLSPEGVVTSWNAGAERIKGYRADEIIGRHFSRFYSAEDIAGDKPWNELSVARRTGRAEGEGWRIKKNGERFWSRFVVTALRDGAGRLRGFAKVTQDLTERRHMQELEIAAQNVREFIATLAHELRNPLAPIRSAVQVLSMQAPEGERATQLLHMIDRQSAHLVRIVDDLIDVSRIARGVMSVAADPVDLVHVAHLSIEAAMPLIEANRHTLSVFGDEAGPVIVQGDAARLAQLVTNLLNNAARYTPAGGDIRLSLHVGGDAAELSVSDNGRGIRRDMLDAIFHMFVQGPTPTTRAAHGLGVGLALARRIAELHGGSLQAYSEGENLGATFTLRLPLAGTHPRVVAAQRERAVPTRACRILVVDDNVDAARGLEAQLRLLGHDVRVATNGRDAQAIAEDFMPNLALVDIEMPDLKGDELAQRLRAVCGEGLRVAAVTGSTRDVQASAAARGDGIDVRLIKPVDLEALHATITAMLSMADAPSGQ